jgi:hypothetical protein
MRFFGVNSIFIWKYWVLFINMLIKILIRINFPIEYVNILNCTSQNKYKVYVLPNKY